MQEDQRERALLSVSSMAEMIGETVAQIAFMNRLSIPNTKPRDTKTKPATNRDKIKAARKQRNRK